jgi:hypothetical protein
MLSVNSAVGVNVVGEHNSRCKCSHFCVQVYGPLPSGENPTAVNKYFICLYSVVPYPDLRAVMSNLIVILFASDV